MAEQALCGSCIHVKVCGQIPPDKMPCDQYSYGHCPTAIDREKVGFDAHLRRDIETLDVTINNYERMANAQDAWERLKARLTAWQRVCWYAKINARCEDA